MNAPSLRRRAWLLWLFVFTLASASRAQVQSVGAVGMTVADLDRSVAFYTKVLGFEPVGEAEAWGDAVEHLTGVFGARVRVARLRLGDEQVELTEYLTPTGRPIPVDSRSNDRWFQHIALAVRDMDAAYAHLRAHDVRHASTAPQTIPDWNTAAAGIRAFYFKDPDGHNLEAIYFPPGKGDPRWQQPTDRLFLGIDHTAIVVGETEASLRFYRDLLGLRVAGESENYGTEQEHLNNVFGAHLHITGLRAPRGPGVEFLEYLAPSDGRPYPADARPNDLVHWQTTLVVADVAEAAERLRAAGYAFVSSGVPDLSGTGLGFRHGVLVRDPDGHVMQVVEPDAASPLTSSH